MRNLVITGFMGSGKTAVGRQVARQLGRPFADMDAEIEARAGKSVARIFAEDGEAAFRQMEAALCRELAAQEGLVIATGGGALIDAGNQTAMLESGMVVCLICTAEEILRRVHGGGDGERPLLAVADPQPRSPACWRQGPQPMGPSPGRSRQRGVPWQSDTGYPCTGERRSALYSHPAGAYLIYVGEGMLEHLGGTLREAGITRGTRIAIVSNPVVAPLYGAQVEAGLQAAGFQPFVCFIPDGEQHKTLATVASLYEQFLAGGLDRSGLVLSLGGGVTGDIAGFAAASFMRGVRFVQVPTTLLSMVDASVGGKTGVDLPQGKNLVGAFKQPELVLIDPEVLTTLPPEELRAGMAEVLKHGVIGDPALFADLEAGPREGQRIGSQQIARALRVKAAIVEEDPFEQGRRAVLNLGHTVGHALERLSGFQLRHGEAVGIGMVAAVRIAVVLGRADAALVARIEAALRAWGLPVCCQEFAVEAILGAMAHDKKRQGRGLRWVLPDRIGQVEITDAVPVRWSRLFCRRWERRKNDGRKQGTGSNG
jgi:3-dehydroquinate synthase